MSRLRVLIAEDSPTVRSRLVEALVADPEIEIVGEAVDGQMAIALCAKLRPDVVTMDMMMPVMTGLAATEYIMAHCPTPILIVSASTNRGELFKTYDALAAGAVDVLEKPTGDDADGVWEDRFQRTVRLVSRVRVITHPRARLGSLGLQRVAPSPSEPHVRGAPLEVVAIGASTGGPGAIVDILRCLPKTFPLPVLVVLHIHEPFASSFAEWLGTQTDLDVSYAKDGEPLFGRPGRVVMAPPDRHLVVESGRLRLHRGPERHSCRPSIDELFESLARECGQKTLAALLTGMGKDGALGLLALRRAGGFTIAQDEATSIVYGMPREAALLDAAVKILPLGEIGPLLGAKRAKEEPRS